MRMAAIFGPGVVRSSETTRLCTVWFQSTPNEDGRELSDALRETRAQAMVGQTPDVIGISSSFLTGALLIYGSLPGHLAVFPHIDELVHQCPGRTMMFIV